MDTNEKAINMSYLGRISNILLINGGFLANPGLFTGEMSLILFFFHFSRFTHNKIYSEYSSHLLEKIQKKINTNTSICYEQGLTGIGSAIEYLVQNGFIKADTDDILEDFDKRIFFTYNLPYLPINQIADIGYYSLWRLAGKSAKKEMIVSSIVPQIVNLLEERQTGNIMHFIVSFLKDISSKELNIIQDRSIISNLLMLNRLNLSSKPFLHLLERFPNNVLNLSFQNGLAGLGLFLISELDGDDTWLSLFPNYLIPQK